MKPKNKVAWRWAAEHILITGGSSGLGEALVKRGFSRGARITIVARDEARVKEVVGSLEAIDSAKRRVRYFLCDLAETSEISNLFDQIVAEQEGQYPSLLINNAGYNAAGFVLNTPIDVYQRNYAVNTIAPIALMQFALPRMIEAKHGGVVNIVSAAMYHSFPGISSYCASKFALGAIHESLESELYLDPIQTLYVNPGGFQSRYWEHLDHGGRLKNYQHPKRSKDRPPEQVAEAIYCALESGKQSLDLSGSIDHVGEWLNFFMPGVFKSLLSKRNIELLKNRP